MDDEDPDRVDAAADLANEMSDTALTLVEDYGWSEDDVLAHIRAVLRS